MCAQYMLLAKHKEWLARFWGGGEISEGRILPGRSGWVIVRDPSGGGHLELMRFGVVPSWSRDSKPKFSTHNARLESTDAKTGARTWIYQKPTWRTAFGVQHCLVPMSTFIEPSYSGAFAGYMVGYSSLKDQPILAAAIWDEWVSTDKKEIIRSFAILTDEPYPTVMQSGHDRSPIFLNESGQARWLDNSAAMTPSRWIDRLREDRIDPGFEVTIDRPLASGWQKRRS